MSNTSIPLRVKLMLVARAAGRCEFRGCNRKLTEHDLTGQQGRFGAFAHIVADSPGGPRGDPILSPKLAKELSNLMLLCADDHKLIDDPATGERDFPGAALLEMKLEHERRVAALTAIDGNHRTHLLLMEAPIGERLGLVVRTDAEEAALPRWAPKEATTITLSSRLKDGEALAWRAGAVEIERAIADIDELRKRKEVAHVSVFALAPIPLLAWLGYLLGDIQPASVFQRRRDVQGWRWAENGEDLGFQLSTRGKLNPGQPAVLALDVSDSTTAPQELLSTPTVRLSAREPGLDIVRCPEQAAAFVKLARRAMHELGECSEIHVIAAVPNSLAIEFGRLQLPKAHPPLVLYDRHDGRGGLAAALRLHGGTFSVPGF